MMSIFRKAADLMNVRQLSQEMMKIHREYEESYAFNKSNLDETLEVFTKIENLVDI